MAILGKYLCGGDNVINTGLPTCDMEMSVFTRFHFVPKGTRQTQANLLVFDTFLTNAYKDDLPAKRYYPFVNAVDTQDKSEAATYETYPDGSKVKIRDGKYMLEFKFKGGIKAYQQHKSFDKKHTSFDVQFIDEISNAVLGTKYKNSNSFDFAGFSLSMIDVSQYKHASQAGSGEWMITLTLLNNAEFDANGVAVQFDSTFSVGSLQGLRDIDITINTQVTNVLNVTVTANGENLLTLYPTAIVQTAIWKATKADNTVLAITSVAASTTTVGAITVTFDSTAYTALAAGSVLKLTLGPVSAMTAALINGYEGESYVTIIK